MRIWSIAIGLAALWMPLSATTLEKMGLDDMARKSTLIVRGKVLGSSGEFRGQDIYTFYRIQVLEGLKSGTARELRVAVPGGIAGGLRQSVAGAPVLQAGNEYVMFLWTSRSGLTQLIGLSQGLFDVQRTSGKAVAARPAAEEIMLDRSGHAVRDEAVVMPLSDLRNKIKQVLSAAK